MIAFLFGLFVVILVGAGLFKIFGAKRIIKGTFINIGRLIIVIVGFGFVLYILSFLNLGGLLRQYGQIIILAFIGLAVLFVCAVVAKIFGGKVVAKFMLFIASAIIFILVVFSIIAIMTGA